MMSENTENAMGSELAEGYTQVFSEKETDQWNVDSWILRTLPPVLITVAESVMYPKRWLDVELDQLNHTLALEESVERRDTAAELLEIAAHLKGWEVVYTNNVPYLAKEPPGQELGQILAESWDEVGRTALRNLPLILDVHHVEVEELEVFITWVKMCAEKLHNLADRGLAVPLAWESLTGERVQTGTHEGGKGDASSTGSYRLLWVEDLKKVAAEMEKYANSGDIEVLVAPFCWMSTNFQSLWD